MNKFLSTKGKMVVALNVTLMYGPVGSGVNAIAMWVLL